MNYIKHKSEESVEDYLEAILVLNKRQGDIRSIDIANELSYSKPSVSVAMKNLKNRNYISVSSEGFIRLTEEGLKVAEAVYERHSILSNWLISLGVNTETALEDACKMEHDISEESFEAIKKYLSEHSK